MNIDLAEDAVISDVFMLIFRYFVKLDKVKVIYAFNLVLELIQAPEFIAEGWPPIFWVCRFFISYKYSIVLHVYIYMTALDH